MLIGAPLGLHATLVPLYKRKSETLMNKIYGLYFFQCALVLGFFDRIEIPREEQVIRILWQKIY